MIINNLNIIYIGDIILYYIIKSEYFFYINNIIKNMKI